jgi:hypothetical protein
VGRIPDGARPPAPGWTPDPEPPALARAVARPHLGGRRVAAGGGVGSLPGAGGQVRCCRPAPPARPQDRKRAGGPRKGGSGDGPAARPPPRWPPDQPGSGWQRRPSCWRVTVLLWWGGPSLSCIAGLGPGKLEGSPGKPEPGGWVLARCQLRTGTVTGGPGCCSAGRRPSFSFSGP